VAVRNQASEGEFCASLVGTWGSLGFSQPLAFAFAASHTQMKGELLGEIIVSVSLGLGVQAQIITPATYAGGGARLANLERHRKG
jgi:hypothetical protein